MQLQNQSKTDKKMAEAYLYINEITNQDCRIDVIAILMLDKIHPK